MVARQRPDFEGLEVGQEAFVSEKLVRREDVKAYADASGDYNPLHQDDDFARGVGFPGIIAHGMFSLAHLVKAVKDWAVSPGAFRSIDAQFRAVVYMDETLVARGKVAALDPETKDVTLEVWAEVERDGEVVKPIKNSRAVVNLA